MSTTVIYSNMGDRDTDVLKHIWKGIRNAHVYEFTRDSRTPIDDATAAIEQESDTLIMAGHGSPYGLFNPSFSGNNYLVNDSNREKIHAKRIIGIWCHAKDFAKRQKLNGFFSSMFISNSNEAAWNGILNADSAMIWKEEILFCERLNKLIRCDISMEKWADELKMQADYTNEVVKFNYDGLEYFA